MMSDKFDKIDQEDLEKVTGGMEITVCSRGDAESALVLNADGNLESVDRSKQIICEAPRR